VEDCIGRVADVEVDVFLLGYLGGLLSSAHLFDARVVGLRQRQRWPVVCAKPVLRMRKHTTCLRTQIRAVEGGTGGATTLVP
jgi:hypothetical protein